MRWEYDYTNRAFGKTFSDMAKTFWHFWIKKRVMVCDLMANNDPLHGKEYYIREDYWTDIKLSNLHEMGYRVCENLPGHDNLAWVGVPVMIKLRGFKMQEVTDPEFTKDDPMFLNDRMESNLLNKFAKSLARASLVAGMDIQKLLLMGGIAIAAIVGMKFMGVF